MKEKMTNKKWLIATIALAVVAAIAIAVAIGLGIGNSSSGGNDRVFGVGEEGVYYYEVVDGKVVLTLRDGTFTLSGQINKTGVYSVDGSNISLDFFKDEDGTATATLNGDALSLVYENANLSFLKEIEYTVSFNTNDGSDISAVKVINGKTAGKPAQDPTKENHVFIGWYADEALTTPFNFDKVAVKSDLTVYAKWAEKIPGIPNYVVSFDTGDYDGAQEFAPITTVSGIAYGIPTPERQGYTFGGWWISMYDDGNKLSYVYKEGTAFTKDTTLYAVWHDDSSANLNTPAVSITENMISWEVVNNATSYKLTVIKPDGTVVIDNETVTGTNKEFKFEDLEAGEYKVSVVAVANNEEQNSEAADRYFANKTLDKVTDFHVENGILVFGAVEGAEKYTISITCGNANHNHTNFDNGTSTTYYLANCQMKEGGITITVTASAQGFASSTSDVFTYDKTLGAVENLKYDAKNDKFTWTAVAGAASYKVTVTVGENTYTFNNGSANSFSVAGFTGNIQISVTPTSEGYNSPAAATASYQKTAPAAPAGLTVSGNVISWSAVEGTNITYEVMIGTQTAKTNGTTLNLSDASFTLTQGQTYPVKVKAINENGESSSFSEIVEIGYATMNPILTYAQNTVYWSPVLGVEQYQIRVNGGEIEVVNNVNSAKVKLTKEGENLIEVRYVQNGEFSEWSSVTVNAFAVEYDTRTLATGILTIEYLAIGDYLTLPAEGFSYEGYDFTGWYNSPKGALGNGKLYGEGSVFSGNAYTIVYAEWTPKTYYVTYEFANLGFTVTNLVSGSKEPVIYTKDFKLTVPEAQNTGIYFFAGWYTGTAGTGIQITDENGNSLIPYEFTRDITLYPYYSTNVLNFTLQDDNTYAVSKGDTISSVTSVKIPVTFNDIPVTVVLENAFSSCTTLTKIEIPDTIKLVGTGAFNGCSKLEYIDVYVAHPDQEGQYETVYSDDNGVLIREDWGTTWLEFFPRAMTGEYTISSDVEQILPKAFYMSKISKITIPKSINTIPEYAFYSCTNLESIEFEGGRTTPVEFTKNSFYFPSYNSIITTIKLPALMNIDYSALKSTLNYLTKLTAIEVEEGGETFASVNGILTDASKTTMLYGPRGYTGDLSIPLGVTAIGEYAFDGCDFITSVTIPVWVTEIGKYAFQYCEGVTAVTIKGGRTENLNIGEDAFWCLYNLQTVTFEGNGTDTLDQGQITMGKLAFYGSSSSTKLHTVTIGDGVNIKSIGQQAFQTQSKLENFIVSEKAYVGAIDERAFEKCLSLTTFKIPATVTNIAANAFNACTSLATIEFATAENEPELVIADLAFNGCTALKAVEIPDRLKSFEASAFEGCTGLKAFTVKSTNEKYVTDANGILYAKNFDENNNVIYTELLFYPKGLVAENNGVINNLPETLTTIGGSAFSDNNHLTSIVIPAKVTSIGTAAFANCEKLSSVQFAEAAEGATLTIGDSAFLNCKSLTDEFSLPSYTTTIGTASFQGCTFTKFVIPEGVTSIGMAAFWGSETLEYVEFKCKGDLVIEDGSANNATKGGAFSNCTALTRVDLPTTLVELGNYTFYKCYALETVNLGKVTIKDGVYTVDSKLVRIGNRAFEQCVALQTIVIPKSVTAIGTSAFAATEKVTASNPGQGNLTSIIFEKGGTETLNFGSNVFWYQPNLAVLNLPERVRFPMPTNLQEKNGSTAIKDANGNNMYIAPHTGLTQEVTQLANLFKGCTALAEINIEADDAFTGLYTSIDGVLYSADKTVLVFCPFANVGTYKDGAPTYELIIPNTVEMVLTDAIANCTALKTVTFAEFDKSDAKYGTQILVIGNYTNSSGSADKYMAIGGAESAITKINLPSHLKEISFNAFTMGAKVAELEPVEIVFNPDANNVVIEKYGFYYSGAKTLALPGIKSLGDYAFAYAAHLESITFASLDPSIKKLPVNVFQKAEKLAGFEIPAQITEIGNYAFHGCTSIIQIVIPETVTKLGNYAFQATGLTSVTLHSGLTNANLGTNLFRDCVDLKTVTFQPKANGTFGMTQISDYMFYGCLALEEINIYDFAEKLTKIGNSAFYQCESLFAFDFTKFTSLTTLGTNTFSHNPNYVRVDLSQTKVTNINTAFNNLSNLKEFVYPETLTTETSATAFRNCLALERVYLTKSFKSAWISNVNRRIVQESNVPVEIIIPADNPNFIIDEFGVVYDPAMQTIYFVSPTADLSNYTIPESVLTIGAYAFAFNKSFTTMVIPEGVTMIGQQAFLQTAIESVVIPSSVEELGLSVFYKSELKNVTFTDTIELPSKLTTMGATVFAYTKLVSIVLPDQLTTIGNSLFSECDDLKSITLGASMKEVPNGLASQANGLEEIHMQEGVETIRWIFSSYSYRGGYGMNKVTSIHIPASVKTIESDAFCDFGNLQTVTFAEGSALETIAKHAFERCVSLETVTGIPASLATLGEAAFKGCESLTALDLSATAVTEILKETFYNTKSMTAFALPQSLTTIGAHAFYNTGIAELTIPATVTSIGNSAFENADLETLTFSKACIMTTLGELLDGTKDNVANIFRGTDKLETVVLPNSIQTIGRGVFNGSAVKNILMTDENMPSSLTYIGDSAFANCVNLTSFAYLEQVTEIGEKAFFNCSSLENTTVSEGLKALGAMAFAFCNKLTTAYIPETLTTLGGNPYAGIDLSKLNVAAENEYFLLETDENGITTLYDSEKTIIYAVYGLTGAFVMPNATDSATYAPGALAGNAITDVTIPEGIEVLPDYMFMNCNALVNVTLPEGLTEIGQYAFYNTGLTTITIPGTVTTIGDAAFMYCESINNVVMPKSVVTMGNYLFAYCTALSNFEFETYAEGETVKTQKVGTHFFFNCPNITEVILPQKINITDEDKADSATSYTTDIPSYMFAGTGIVNAEIPKNGVSFYFFTRGVFANCKNLVSVYIEEVPDNSTTSYGYCNPLFFEGCDKLEALYIDTFDKSGYVIAAVSKWPTDLHVKKSVKDETANQLNASAYLDRVYNEELEVHFDADTYTDIIEYFDGVTAPWKFQVYDKDGNRLYCNGINGSVGYVEDAQGNVIWGEKPAN